MSWSWKWPTKCQAGNNFTENRKPSTKQTSSAHNQSPLNRMVLRPSSPFIPFQTKQMKNLPCGTGLDWDVLDQIWAGLPRVVFLSPTWPIIISLVEHLKGEGWWLGVLHRETKGWQRRWLLQASPSLLQPPQKRSLQFNLDTRLQSCTFVLSFPWPPAPEPWPSVDVKRATPFLEFILAEKPGSVR